MENGIGNILYIILMVIVLALSMLKKAKSPGSEDTSMPEREVDESPGEAFPRFDDWFDKKEDVRQEPVKRPNIQPVPAKKLEYQPLEYKKIGYSLPSKRVPIKKRTVAKQNVMQTVRKSVTKEEPAELTTFWEREPIDLKRAIIYSEIIKRPNF